MSDSDWASIRIAPKEGNAASIADEEIHGATVLQSSPGVGDRHAEEKRTGELHQTAQAWAEGIQRCTLIRLLLDIGSQRTLIQWRVSEKLQLKVLREEELQIFTFGDNTQSIDGWNSGCRASTMEARSA